MTRALVLVLLGIAGCGGESPPPIDVDAGCGAAGVAPDQPVIACPASVDLGCLGPEGAPLELTVSTASCDGSAPTVVCTPADGATVTPGTSSGRCVATAPSGATDECTFAIAYRTRGAPTIACGAAVTAECAGATTPVPLAPPGVMASCDGGSTVGTPTSDAPSGFPLGATDVHWSATVTGGSPLACTQTVTIEDETAPSISCPSGTTMLIRTSPTDPISVPGATATDTCDASVAITLDPPVTMRGTFRVTATATDDAGLTATCAFDAQVVDLFAPTLRLISAELQGDGSTDATLAWELPASPDATGVRLERATSATGPFTALMTLAPGTTTYTDAAMPSPRAFYRAVTLGGVSGGAAIDGGASATIQADAIAAAEYDLSGQTVPSVPFPTSLFGVVRHPVDLTGAPRPLVVLLHGNHGNCRPASGDDDCATQTTHACTDPGHTTTPNAHGYVYLQETLAAQGYVTVSLSANALNCRDDYIPQRTQLILEHLRRWVAWNGASGGAPFGTLFSGRLDLSRVALFGHSRGGEAVAAAPAALRATPIAGVTLASVLGVGSTDYHTPTPSGVPFLALLPACDADVRTLEALLQYDRGLDPADANARAQVLFVGANHNFFNSEWRFDDNQGSFAVCTTAQQVGAPAQRAMLEIVFADWLASTVGDARVPAYVRAEAGTPAVISSWAGRPLDLRWSYAAAMRRVIDDFEGTGAPMTNDLGGTNAFTGYTATLTCTGSCAGNFPHDVTGVRLAWDAAAATATWSLGDLDASAYDVVSLRFASRIATINDAVTEHDFTIGVRDAAGTVAEVALSDVGRLAHRYPSTRPREILTTVRVPLATLRAAAPTLDVSSLADVHVAMPSAGGNPRGSIWVADVEVSGD